MAEIEIQNYEHARKILNQVKKYFQEDDVYKLYFSVLKYDDHKKHVAEKFKNKYRDDEEFRKKKYDQIKAYQLKKKQEKMNNNI